MTHTYRISGMTCGGCKASVEHALKQLKNVKTASVNLVTSEAHIELLEPLKLSDIQAVLPTKYTISLDKSTVVNPLNGIEESSKIRQLQPLFIIFGYLLTAAALLNLRPWSSSGFMMDFMGLFFIVFSFFKVLDLKNFPASFAMYDPFAKVLPAYGWMYPFIEIGLGLMFLFRYQVTTALLTTLIILGFTTLGVIKVLLQKKQIQCACLGTILKLPMTQATLIENSIMIIMALAMLLNPLAS